MLNCPWMSHGFHSDFNSKSRRIDVLISKTVHLSPTDVRADKYGRYVIAAGILMQKKGLLVNIYAPNIDDGK